MATKDINDCTYEELQAAADAKKQAKIALLTKEAEEAEQSALAKRREISSLTGIPLEPAKRRGRKPGSRNRAPMGKSLGRKKGKRSGPTAKQAILDALKKGPAASKELIASIRINPGSITQALVAMKKNKIIKHEGKKGGKYSLVNRSN